VVTSTPWWKGARGEWYVVVQMLLIALVLLGPRTLPGWPVWEPPYGWIATGAGAVLAVAGGALAAAGLFGLGQSNLTALPYPKDEATLVETGPYAIVRHPIYSGLVFGALGLGLFVHGWLTIGYATALFAFFDVKSRREERWLTERFPEYAEYRRRVRKLVPWVY
jgi:protein-S-isoprenylcysteine O-methyltransferase Ste14